MTTKSDAEVAGQIIVAILWLSLMAWVVMLTLGMGHTYHESIPPMGYWGSALAVFLVHLIPVRMRK